MRIILHLLSILIVLKSTKQILAFGGVNEGASTSRASDERHVTDKEKCEIDNYVETFFNLIMAEDSSDSSVEHSLYQDYFDEVEKYLRYGTESCDTYESDESLRNYRGRASYFKHRLSEKFSEMMINACSDKFSQRVQIVFNKLRGSLWTVRTNSVAPNTCSTSESGSDPNFAGFTKKKYQTLKRKHHNNSTCPEKVRRTEENNPDGVDLSRHNIIPKPLFAKFYEIWYRSSQSAGFDETNCLVTRILSYFLDTLLKTESTTINARLNNEMISNNSLLNSALRRLLYWLPDANDFIGPTPELRGPFHPMFHGNPKFGKYAFEFESKSIIGRERYDQLLDIFERMLDYVNFSSRLSDDYQRSITGSQIIISMLLTFTNQDLARFDVDQWENRVLTESELSRIPEERRNAYRGKKFWKIKKNEKREKRFLANEKPVDEQCHEMEDLARRRWSEFVVYLMNEFLKSKSYSELISWSCGFVRLYSKYQFSTSSIDCSNLNFDTYLYSKVSRRDDWRECVNFEVDKADDWCLIWRRIMLNSSWSKINAKVLDREFEILVNWLQETVRSSDGQTKTQVKVSAKKLVCYKKVSSINCSDYCKRNMYRVSSERAKRELTSKDEIMVLLEENGNKVMCTCPEDTHVIINKSVGSHEQEEPKDSFFGFLVDLFGNPCSGDSPMYDTSRCQDLRKR